MTALIGYVRALGMGGDFHPFHAEVEVEYGIDSVHTLTYTCPMGEAPKLNAEVKVTIEVQP